MRFPPSLLPSLLQVEQAELPQPFLICSTSDHLRGPPLDLLQQLRTRPVLRAPGPDAVLQMGHHEGRVQGADTSLACWPHLCFCIPLS